MHVGRDHTAREGAETAAAGLAVLEERKFPGAPHVEPRRIEPEHVRGRIGKKRQAVPAGAAGQAHAHAPVPRPAEAPPAQLHGKAPVVRRDLHVVEPVMVTIERMSQPLPQGKLRPQEAHGPVERQQERRRLARERHPPDAVILRPARTQTGLVGAAAGIAVARAQGVETRHVDAEPEVAAPRHGVERPRQAPDLPGPGLEEARHEARL